MRTGLYYINSMIFSIVSLYRFDVAHVKAARLHLFCSSTKDMQENLVYFCVTNGTRISIKRPTLIVIVHRLDLISLEGE